MGRRQRPSAAAVIVSVIVMMMMTLNFEAWGKMMQPGSSNHHDLRYIGLFRNPPGATSSQIEKRQTTSIVQQTSYYFLSQNAAAHFTAESDCKAYLGDDASLLYIETKEELKAVTKFLADSDDTGSIYWIGMKYDQAKRGFYWGNGAEVGPWGPWDRMEPETETAVTRVALYTAEVRGSGLRFRTQLQTISLRYICELKKGSPEEEALPCYKNNDLAIVLDSSDSVSHAGYGIALEFVARLAIAWSDNPDNSVTIVSATQGKNHAFPFVPQMTLKEYRDQILRSTQTGGASGFEGGVERAIKEVKDFERNVSRMMVIVTMSPIPQAKEISSKLTESHFTTYMVGVGEGAKYPELLDLADNKFERIFTPKNYEGLLRNLQSLSRKICLEVGNLFPGEAPKGEVKEYVA